MVEETMRIPLLMRGPGIGHGRTCGQLVANFDIAPTILQMCGIDHDTGVHGMSLFELLGGPTAKWRKGLMAEHYGLHEPALQRAYYMKRWKLVVQEVGFAELYDLRADPYEMRNLAAVSEYRRMLERMWAGLHEAMTVTDDCGLRLSRILGGPPSPQS